VHKGADPDRALTLLRSFVATLAALLLILQVASPVVEARQYGPADAELLTPVQGAIYWLESDGPGTGERATHCAPPSTQALPGTAMS